MRKIILFFISITALSGCLPDGMSGAPDRAPAGDRQPSAPRLTGLTPGQVPALDGELGCSFTVAGSNSVSVLAKAWVDGKSIPDAVAGLDGSPVRLTGTAPLGYGRLEAEAASFEGPGVRITISLNADPRPVNGEQLARGARLKIDADNGAERTEAGTWTCGP